MQAVIWRYVFNVLASWRQESFQRQDIHLNNLKLSSNCHPVTL